MIWGQMTLERGTSDVLDDCVGLCGMYHGARIWLASVYPAR